MVRTQGRAVSPRWGCVRSVVIQPLTFMGCPNVEYTVRRCVSSVQSHPAVGSRSCLCAPLPAECPRRPHPVRAPPLPRPPTPALNLRVPLCAVPLCPASRQAVWPVVCCAHSPAQPRFGPTCEPSERSRRCGAFVTGRMADTQASAALPGASSPAQSAQVVTARLGRHSRETGHRGAARRHGRIPALMQGAGQRDLMCKFPIKTKSCVRAAETRRWTGRGSPHHGRALRRPVCGPAGGRQGCAREKVTPAT